MDLSCEDCQLQKERGGKRPTCEECGRIELNEEGQFIVDILYNHQRLLVVFNGMGGYYINSEGVNFICEKTGYNNPLRFAGLIETVVNKQLENIDRDNKNANKK